MGELIALIVGLTVGWFEGRQMVFSSTARKFWERFRNQKLLKQWIGTKKKRRR